MAQTVTVTKLSIHPIAQDLAGATNAPTAMLIASVTLGSNSASGQGCDLSSYMDYARYGVALSSVNSYLVTFLASSTFTASAGKIYVRHASTGAVVPAGTNLSAVSVKFAFYGNC
jgi:hypothetical protein